MKAQFWKGFRACAWVVLYLLVFLAVAIDSISIHWRWQ